MSSSNNSSKSFDGSNTSLKHVKPPWCSGKLRERRKLLLNREIQSSYPLRENIWEYLHNDENLKLSSKRLNRKRNKPGKRCGRKTKLILLILLCLMTGTVFWMQCNVQSLKIFNKIIPTTELLTANLLKIIDWKKPSMSEECCHNMRFLALELLLKERILRNTLRLKLTWRDKDPIKKSYIEDSVIQDLTALGGSETEELYSRSVTLWGVGPLWQTSPSPNIVLSLKNPQPADCWAFRGSTGKLHIYLPYPQEVKSISVEHIMPDSAKSAPKLFKLTAVHYDDSETSLLKGQYRHDGPAKQYFRIKCDDMVKEVIFDVLSNHGNKTYTCIYRIHLYGN